MGSQWEQPEKEDVREQRAKEVERKRAADEVWFTSTATGKTLPISRVLLALGIIPSDSLYKAIPSYLEAVVKISDKRVGIDGSEE